MTKMLHVSQWITLTLMLCGLMPARAQDPDLGDKREGEEEQIVERERWFYESRGLENVERPDLRRKQALDQVKAMLAEERAGDRAAAAWTSVGPSPMTMLNWAMGNVAGRLAAIGVDPNDSNTVFAGAAAGGLWKTTNGGTTWVPLFDAIGTESIGAIFIEAANGDHVWVGTGEHASGCTSYFGLGLFKSVTGGAGFEARNGSGGNTLDLSFISAIVAHPAAPEVLLVGGKGFCNGGSTTTGGIFRSTDDGLTWTNVLAGQVNDVIAHPVSADIFYATVGRSGAAENGVYKSEDAGLTWQRQENGAPVGGALGRSRIAISKSDPQTLYLLTANDSLYRTQDGGATWTQRNTNACQGQCSYNLCIDVHPTQPDNLLVGTINLNGSSNGGQTIQQLTANWGSGQEVHQDTHIVRYDSNNPSRYWVGSDGGLWRTENGGNSYINMNGNLNITQLYDIAVNPANPARIFGGAQDNSSQRTAGNILWNVTRVTGDGFLNLVNPINPNIVIQTSYPSGGFPNLYRSTTGGDPNTFTFAGTNGLISGPFPFVTPLAISANAAETAAFMFVGSDRVFLSSDNASSWTPISNSLGGTLQIIMALPNGATVAAFAATGGQIHRTTDALAVAPVWQNITANYPGGTISDIAADPADVDRIFITRSGFGLKQLYRSTNGGSSWQGIGIGLPDIPANTVALDPLDSDRIFVGTDVGVFESRDGGEHFTTLMVNFPQGTVVTDLEMLDDPHLMTAATFGRGAWQIPLTIEALGVEAGPDQSTCTGQFVPLAAVASNGSDPLTWEWSVVSGPDSSVAQFSDPGIPNPEFTPSATGTYVLQVQLSDFFFVETDDQLTVETIDAVTFENRQRENWASAEGDPGWQANLDRNGNHHLDILDILIQQANPICN